ncbi:hypothetical protein DITRI_Ditri15bG0073100 [Diplodiscus trichospermus]
MHNKELIEWIIISKLLLKAHINDFDFEANRGILKGKSVKWNQTTDCRSWAGASCEAGGGVIGLDLSNKFISGVIDNSSSLFRLRLLQRLNLAYKNFKFMFPSGLTRSLKLEKPNLEMLVRNLTRPRSLHLDGVNISASGKEWGQALSSLTNLQVISMSKCYLSGPIDSSFSKLRSLSMIRLDSNNLSAPLPKFFAEFQNLTFIHLSSTGLTGGLPEEIFHAATLQTLDLSNMFLKGLFPDIPPNSSLKNLVLSDTNFGGPLPESTGNLGQLTRIELARCNFSGLIPKSLLKLT